MSNSSSGNSFNPITKERTQKTTSIIILIAIIAIYLFICTLSLHATMVQIENPRATFTDAINGAGAHFMAGPFNIGPAMKQIGLWLFLGGIAGAVLILMYRSTAAMKKHDPSDTVKGRAHFMTLAELKEFNKHCNAPFGSESSESDENMILSQDIRLGMDDRKTFLNCNVLTIGASGAGKSRYFAAPNILQFNTNFVITDPSGELLRDYGKALEDNGYIVNVFNLSDPFNGDRYNPFNYIQKEKDVFILVNSLIKNTTPPDSHANDPFWENSEKVLLSALILYVWHRYPKKERTFNAVMKLLSIANVDEETGTSPLDDLFKDFEEQPGVGKDNLAIQQYQTFKLGAGKTLKSILISVGVRLESFKLADIKYLTSADDFDFYHFADRKRAIFVVLPTGEDTFNFLASLMYSQLFTTLYDYCESYGQYGWAISLNGKSFRTEHAHDEEESIEAKKKIEAFKADIEKGCKIEHNKERSLYEIRTVEGNELVTWRGRKTDAEKIMSELKNVEINPTVGSEGKGRCPHHVRFILDEFANIGQIPQFEQKLSTIRKYAISCSIIIQALSQLKGLYEKQWNTIISNCDTKLLLGCDDPETLEWAVKMFGKKTTTVENTSWQGSGQGSTSYNKDSIELISESDLGLMAKDECIVRIRQRPPYYGKKFELTGHKNYKYAKSRAGKYKVKGAPAEVRKKLVVKPWIETAQERKVPLTTNQIIGESPLDKSDDKQDKKGKENAQLKQNNQANQGENKNKKPDTPNNKKPETSNTAKSSQGIVSTTTGGENPRSKRKDDREKEQKARNEARKQEAKDAEAIKKAREQLPKEPVTAQMNLYCESLSASDDILTAEELKESIQETAESGATIKYITPPPAAILYTSFF